MSSVPPLPLCSPSEDVEELDPYVLIEELPPEDVFTRAFFELKPVADAIAAEVVRVMNVDPQLAYVNAKKGYAIFEPALPVARAIPKVNIEAIERVPNAALALLGATHRLNLLVVSKSELPEKLFRGRQLRAALLPLAEACVTLGLLPEAPVAHIRKGTGPLDTARDLIELSILFRDHEASLRDMLAPHPSLLREAAELGTWLRDAMQPMNAPPRPKSTPAEIKQATDERNRMWTLLYEGYAELSRVAVFLGLDVPSLQSRRGLAKKRKG